MKYKELIEKTKDINLENLGVFLGKEVKGLGIMSLWQENNSWYLQQSLDSHRTLLIQGSESDICEQMYQKILEITKKN